MTARGTVLLLTVLAGLAGYLWFGELRRRHGSEPPPRSAGAPLLALPAPRIVRVELAESGRRLTAIRRGTGWTDEHGRSWNDRVVPSLLETLATLAPVMVVDGDPAEAAAFGLGPDASRLEVVADDGRPALALELGARNPAWTGSYARLAGEREVILVGAVLRWELEKLRAAAPQPEVRETAR